MAREKILTRPEASMIAKWLKENDIILDQGYLDIWRLTPSVVAEKYGFETVQIEKACRRVLENEEKNEG